MSQQARSEAKRLRRLKRKQDAGNGTVSNSISTTSLTVVGGGTLAAIAIALGVNALSPGGQNASSEDVVPVPTDASQSPSGSASSLPEPTPTPTSTVIGSFTISITPSPSPSSSASPSASPAIPGVIQGSYFAQGRYGAGYYSTAYDVAFSSPMFQAGSGYYYGTSGYAAAKESPHGYYSQGGWSGSGFYESGYFDLSGNTGYYDLSGSFVFSMGSWDGSGITHQYGAGAYYGVLGFSSAEYQPNGSYFSSGHFGSGYYGNLYFDYSQGNQGFAAGTGSYYGISGLTQPKNSPSGYLSDTGNYGSGYYESGYYDFSGNIGGTGFTNYWNGQPLGTGAYYGVSGYSDPIFGVRGNYYASGFAGAGNYASSLTYNYLRVTGNWDTYLYTTAVMGDGTYYGPSGESASIPAPSGSFYTLGEFGSGYYSNGYYSCGYVQTQPTGVSEWNYYIGKVGRRIYYGFSANSTPLYGFYGIYKYDGYAGSGYYEPDPTNEWDGSYVFGTGSYYGASGYGSPIAPPSGQWFYSGWGGSGFYSTGQMGSYWWEGIGTGAYYGSSGNSPSVDPT